MAKSKEKGASEAAQESADRVEDKPSDPTDIFATDFIGSDAEQEEKERVKREAQAKRKAAKRQREREDRMKEMVKEPNKWLRKTEKLAEARGTKNYEAAAEILADLREAVGGDEGDRITRQHAAHLANKHPTLTHLKSSLRKRCLLD